MVCETITENWFTQVQWLPEDFRRQISTTRSFEPLSYTGDRENIQLQWLWPHILQTALSERPSEKGTRHRHIVNHRRAADEKTASEFRQRKCNDTSSISDAVWLVRREVWPLSWRSVASLESAQSGGLFVLLRPEVLQNVQGGTALCVARRSGIVQVSGERPWITSVQLQHRPYHFRCSFCQKCFTDKISLRDHIRNVHSPEDERQFQCDICKKSFAKIYLLRSHLKSTPDVVAVFLFWWKF